MSSSTLNAGNSAASRHIAGQRRGPAQQQSPPQEDDLHEVNGNAASDDANNLDDNGPNADAELSQDASPNAPVQKRRRVTRACDECRKKKIKCDGRQPCTHCTVYSYECTYDQPSHRRRNPPPQYVEQLETRLYRAENILRLITGNVINLDDPQLDQLYGNSVGVEPSGQPDAATLKSLIGMQQTQAQADPNAPQEPDMESMVKTMGQLELDERGYYDYFGHASALSFMRRFRDDFGGSPQPELIGNAKNFPQLSKAFRAAPHESPRATQSPQSHGESPPEQGAFLYGDLPRREKAIELTSNALNDDALVVKVVHRPTFDKQLERLYSRRFDEYSEEDHRFIPLLFSVMSFGCLFSRRAENELDRVGYESATDEGYKYFWATRQLIDVTDTRDLTSLQAVVFMIMFLQCSAKLGTCYTYIGVALRSAVRMGLHRSFDHNFSPIEKETRKRVFWTIRQMDIYVTSFLGLPHFLTEDDIDQEYLVDADDGNITETGITPMPEGQASFSASTNANYQLVEIMTQIIRKIYPIKGLRLPGDNRSRSYSVNYTTIREIEASLQRWKENLPESCLPNADADQPLKLRQYLLRIVYGYAQMMLYRPFLHYVSTTKQDDRKCVQHRAKTCAEACVTVSRNIVHLTTEMKNKGLLKGSYWFTMYATFVAFMSLVFFALENRDAPISKGVLLDALEARDTLAALAKGSMAADRVSRIVNHIVDNLPQDVLKSGSTLEQKQSRKREGSEGSIKRESRSESASSTQRKPKRVSTHPQGGLEAQGAPKRQPANIQPHQSKQQLHQQQPTQASQPNTQYQNYNTSQNLFNPPQMQESSGAAQGMFGQYSQPMEYSQQQQFTLPSNAIPSTEFGDLSNMMFPTANPFDYPNQPMTSLEDINYYSPRNSTFSMSQAFPTTGPQAEMSQMANAPDEQLEAHHFGTVPPPYLNHAQARFGGQTANYNPLDAQSGLMDQSNANQNMWGSGGRPGMAQSMNVQDLFGNNYEWTGPTN